ncbi:MAG: SusD/RagB family nutrient-binding outer membrane lipoprotein [Alistipes sp.]
MEHRHVRLLPIANDWANPPTRCHMTNIYSNWRAMSRTRRAGRRLRMALAQIIRVAIQHVTDIQGPIPLPHDGEQTTT